MDILDKLEADLATSLAAFGKGQFIISLPLVNGNTIVLRMRYSPEVFEWFTAESVLKHCEASIPLVQDNVALEEVAGAIAENLNRQISRVAHDIASVATTCVVLLDATQAQQHKEAVHALSRLAVILSGHHVASNESGMTKALQNVTNYLDAQIG